MLTSGILIDSVTSMFQRFCRRGVIDALVDARSNAIKH
jgi:hypothetical protein